LLSVGDWFAAHPQSSKTEKVPQMNAYLSLLGGGTSRIKNGLYPTPNPPAMWFSIR
jgi:hypothetical protein